VRVGDVKMYSAFNYDWSMENARFFTAFRMTNKGDSFFENAVFFFYCHSERAFGRGRISTVSVRG